MTFMKEREMSLIEHITELRRRLVITFFFFVLFVAAGFLLAKPLIIYLQQTDEAKLLTL
ncbi:twin-arginine translocase subunit TatC, partial [Staphylococcus aureus]|nr:twin-arginine translocase subunit TatC [Staphylococcus aureus]